MYTVHSDNIADLEANRLITSSIERPTLLDAGSLPIEELALIAFREGKRPCPVYGTHKWFARRFSSAFRALLIAASIEFKADFWAAYREGIDWSGRTVLDPFVGGGTSVVEAQRLGANTIGLDVDAVATAITSFETRLANIPDLLPTLEALKKQFQKSVAPFYRTSTPEGEFSEVLHFFWVQIVVCNNCGRQVEAHPHYQLAYQAEGTQQWAFCCNCHKIQVLTRDTKQLVCKDCASITQIQQGPVRYGKLTCPNCYTHERLIDVSRRMESTPQWKLFALETIPAQHNHQAVPMTQRQFHPATVYDQEVFESARSALHDRRQPDSALPWIPGRKIPREGRADDRLLQYGYTTYHELFNARQLLHLSQLAEGIDKLEDPIREAMALAFSDHLTTNCMMTHYAFGWRRLAPLFSIRAFRHVTRPVEINPWLDGTGRGTFPNAVRQVQRAANWARSPKFAHIERVANQSEPSKRECRAMPAAVILNKDSRKITFLKDNTVDLVLTDPPYFDNIAYSELSDFFLPWLQQFGLIPSDDQAADGFHRNIAAKARNTTAAVEFQTSLHKCFTEISRVLRPEGRLVFTYQHKTSEGWYALASALVGTGLKPVQLFPLLGDTSAGLHKHGGSIGWDAVFVMVKDNKSTLPSLMLSEMAALSAQLHFRKWAFRLSNGATLNFGLADQRNFYRACLVAVALDLFPNPDRADTLDPLLTILGADPPIVTTKES